MQSLPQGEGELGYNVRRHPSRTKKGDPDACFEMWKSCLIARRQSWQLAHPFTGCHAIGVDVSGLDLLSRIGDLVTHEVDLARQQIVQRRIHAAIGDGGY